VGFAWNPSLHFSDEVDTSLLGTRITDCQQSISTPTTGLPIQESEFLDLFLGIDHWSSPLHSASETVQIGVDVSD
tara:strand:- start:26 stop:250 length:225 start_codon:yes stop_codon:yes gene_type:complete